MTPALRAFGETATLSSPKTRIYVIQSYGTASTWAVGISRGIETFLDKRGLAYEQKSYEYEDLQKQLASAVQVRRESARMLSEIKAFAPDYIVIADDEAVQAYIESLYPLGLPIIFTGVNRNPSEIPGLSAHRDRVTGVFERYPITQSVKLLRDLTKDSVRSIALITSNTNSSRAIVREFQEYFATQTGQVKLVNTYMLSSWSEWQKAVHEINESADALWMLLPFLVTDKSGKSVPLPEMGAWLSEHIKVPSLSAVDVSLHLGVMASISVTPEGLGEAAAKLIAKNKLDGVPLASIEPVYYDRGDIMINVKQTDQIGIIVPIEILEYALVIKNNHKALK